MASILRKAANYRRIGTVLVEGEAHLKDPLMPPPQVLKPNATPRDASPEDVTDFPAYKTIPIPESIPYREGKYRPPSIPLTTGRP
jgi:CDGSH iron-sulfur domain-containing protein 3